MIPELPQPYKRNMDDALLSVQKHANIAFDIAREFCSEQIELDDGELVITIAEKQGE